MFFMKHPCYESNYWIHNAHTDYTIGLGLDGWNSLQSHSP
jgi:hypothetical protein